MARPKEFGRDEALREAITLFADRGYEGTSTDALLRAMGISRQSMYDTFGDKRNLYLTALRQYNEESVGDLLANLDSGSTPLASLEAAVFGFAANKRDGATIGCLGVSAVCEFGRADADVRAITDALSRRVQKAFEKILVRAKAVGEVRRDVDPAKAARFLLSSISGMKVSMRAGAKPEALRDIARMAIRSLV